MKADEIRKGIKVGVLRGGRSDRLDYCGVVVAVERIRNYGSGRMQTIARVHIHNHEDGQWIPRMTDVDGESVSVVRGFRIQLLISEAALTEREEAARKHNEEMARRRQMVVDVQVGLAVIFERTGIRRDDLHIDARYVAAIDDEPERVNVRDVSVRGESIDELVKFIEREIPYTDPLTGKSNGA